MVSIVTVTCSRDLPQVILQVHSINKFARVPVRHHIFIEDYDMSVNEWDVKLKPHYSRPNKLFLHYGLLPKDFLSGDGWVRQQILKLEAADIVNQDYLVLDSKNFLIKDTIFNYTLNEGCYLRVPSDGIFPTLKPFIPFMQEYLKKDLPNHYFIAHTPFRIIKQNARKLLHECNVRRMFKTASDQGIRPSEFMLYSVYSNPELINMDQTEWDSTYNVNNINYHTWWWNEMIKSHEFEKIYTSTVDFLGIHKNVWAEKNEKLQQLSHWLITKGLNSKFVNDATIAMNWGDTSLVAGDPILTL